MKFLVTGATGSIGANIVRKLAERGEEVRVLIRKTSNTLSIDGLNVEKVYGDVVNYASVRAAVKGCKYVFHTAGISEAGVDKAYRIYEVNDMGALNVVIAAMEVGVEKLVHTSALVALGWGTKENPVTEDMEYNFKTKVPYLVAKRRVEDKILGISKETGFPVVVVNPSMMVGAWDVNAVTGQMILSAEQGATYAYFKGGCNFIDLEDAALGHILALEKGKVGERYILGCENLYYKEYFSIIHRFLGKSKPFLPIVKPISLLLGAVADLHVKYSTSPNAVLSMLSSDVLKLFSLPVFASSEKAIRELGLPQTPVERAVEKQIQWLRDYGYLKPTTKIYPLKKVQS